MRAFHINTVSVVFALLALARSTGAAGIVEYRFNETGTSAPSTGSNPTAVTLRNAAGTATDLHGASGSGVSGLAGDRAFDNTASTEMAGVGGVAAGAELQAIDALQSFTVQGWFKTSADGPPPSGNGGRLFDGTDGTGNGLFLGINNGTVNLQVDLGGATSNAVFQTGNNWTFFAATYNGSDGAVRFYKGTTGVAVALDSATTLAPLQAAVNDEAIGFGFGNNASAQARAFDGLMDNLRIFGSTSDSSGVLDVTQLETLRLQDVQNVPEPGVIPLAFCLGAALRTRRRQTRLDSSAGGS